MYRNCKFHNFARTVSRHADGISRYSVPPNNAGPFSPLALPLSGRLKEAEYLYAPDAPVLDEQRLDAAIVDMMGASRREMFGAAARR